MIRPGGDLNRRGIRDNGNGLWRERSGLWQSLHDVGCDLVRGRVASDLDVPSAGVQVFPEPIAIGSRTILVYRCRSAGCTRTLPNQLVHVDGTRTDGNW